MQKQLKLWKKFLNDSQNFRHTMYLNLAYNSNMLIVSTKVTRVALENAASVSEMLLTTECVITEVKSAEPACQWVVEYQK